jgi:hypothetical protein
MSTHIPQDTISLQLRSDTYVENNTVRIAVTVNAAAPSEQSEETLRADIKSALAKFIPDAEWHFSGLDREVDATGVETVRLIATTRVSEKENVKLVDRAEKASRQGLQLSDVSVDSTVPAVLLEKADKDLRIDILKKALDEIEAIKTVTKLEYRINSLNYQNQGDPLGRKFAASNTSGGGTYAAAASGDDDGAITNAQKVSLTANVILAIFPIDPKKFF